MARILDEELEGLKREVSLARLIEGHGLALTVHPRRYDRFISSKAAPGVREIELRELECSIG